MSKYGSFLYGAKAYGGSVVVINTIDQPESIGLSIPYYVDMVNLLADEHVYPIDDHYMASVVGPMKFELHGHSGEHAEVRLAINGTNQIKVAPVVEYTYSGVDHQLPRHPVWDITQVLVNNVPVLPGAYVLDKAEFTGDVDYIHFVTPPTLGDNVKVSYRSGLFEVADNSGFFELEAELFYGMNTITGTYYYINGDGIPVYGDFEPVYAINNNIHLFLYTMAKQFQDADVELNAIETDSNLVYTRGERLNEIWGNKLNFPYSETVTYAQYRAILFGLTRLYLDGSTLYNLKFALQLIANNPNVKIYEFWRDQSKMIANLQAYWEWNDGVTTAWNTVSHPWADTTLFKQLGLTPFGCQIFFPIDTYTGPLQYADIAIDLTRPAHLIYSLVLWLTNAFAIPDNDVSYTLV